MTNFLILGAGRQGVACAYFLRKYFSYVRIVLVDVSEDNLNIAKSVLGSPNNSISDMSLHNESKLKKVRGKRLIYFQGHVAYLLHINTGETLDKDLTNGEGIDCVISCLPYTLTSLAVDLAKKHRANYCDLGGNIGEVDKILLQHKKAKRAGLTFLPDCGIAPGTVNILAQTFAPYRKGDLIEINCGGLPLKPQGILKYEPTFSVPGLLNEYLDYCGVSIDGDYVEYPGLSEIEQHSASELFRGEVRERIMEKLGTKAWCSDISPHGFETFHTSGGASTAVREYAYKKVDYVYKTIRFSGHAVAIKAMKEAGFFDPDYIDHSAAAMEQGLPSTRKDFLVALLNINRDVDPKLRTPLSSRFYQILLIDKAKKPFTAMERTTGFSLAICAAYISGIYGDDIMAGAFAPYQIIPPSLIVSELQEAGVSITAWDNWQEIDITRKDPINAGAETS